MEDGRSRKGKTALGQQNTNFVCPGEQGLFLLFRRPQYRTTVQNSRQDPPDGRSRRMDRTNRCNSAFPPTRNVR